MAILDYERLLKVPYVAPDTGFEISPSGDRVAFSWNRTGTWEIFELMLEHDAAGKPASWEGASLKVLTGPEPAKGGPGAKFGPRYSPDGRRLAYCVDPDGSELFEIWVCDLETGVHANITLDSYATIQPELAWSPDSSQLAFISFQARRISTFVMPVRPAPPDDAPEHRPLPRLVFDQSGPHCDLHWSPDGRWIAVETESTGQDFAIYLVDPNGEHQAPVPIACDGKLLNACQATWSSDGSRLAFSSDFLGAYEIGVFEPDSGRLSWITSGPGDKSAPAWSPDGRCLAFVHSEGPQTWLGVKELEGCVPTLYQPEPGLHYAPAFTPDGRGILFIFDSPRRPDDIWRLELQSEALIQLTNSLPADLAPEDFVMPEHITYPSRDEQPVPALLYLPRAPVAGLPPAVVNIHGGPSWLFQFMWYPFMSYLASRGWVVLAPNYRGSTGYGRAWQLANRFEMGRGDTMDVAAGAHYLAREGLADPQRIAVSGRSHGGYLTMSCLTEYPDLWVGGSAVVPFLNWFTSHANSRQDLQYWDIENMGDPQQNADLWRERSPFFHLDRVQAPVQLICGANDPRCPASESLAARDALQALGKPVDFVLYPDEGHAFLKIANIVDHELRRAAFLARCLEG